MTRKARESASGGSSGSDAASHVASHRARRAAARDRQAAAAAAGSRGARSNGAADADMTGASPARVATWVITLLLCVTPLIVATSAKESFRLPQGLAAGWLGLASLLVLSWRLQAGLRTDAVHAWRQPAIRAIVPLLIVVAAGALFTAHPAHFRASFADFTIGAACVIGWSLALSGATLRRLLFWTIPPAVLVAALGLDQGAGFFGFLSWMNLAPTTDRLRLTSTIGNPGDLAALLVLPLIVCLSRWRAATRHQRIAIGVAIAVMLVTIAMTATLAAVGAVVAGAGIWMAITLASRGEGRRAAVAAIALVALAVGAVAIAPPLRARATDKIAQLARGDVNALLTGRLDGWRVAIDMLRTHPLRGVSQGAYRAEFAETRLALTDRGVPFHREQTQVILATPHNEALSVAAEQGLPGLAALAWALWCVVIAARRAGGTGNASDADGLTPDEARQRIDTRALIWGALAALGVLATFSFPLHVPAVAWTWLLFLAWVFSSAAERDPRLAAATPDATSASGAALAAPRGFPISGRQLFPFLFVGLIGAIWWQSMRASDRLTASSLLAQVEARTLAAIQLKRAPSTLFTQHLDWLNTAGRLDPLEIGVPLARGSQYLLLRRPDEAIAAYRQAAALEPRPEIDLNLGRALWMRGSQEEARAAFARAVKLSPILREEIPPGILP